MVDKGQSKFSQALAIDMAERTAAEPPSTEAMRAYLDGTLDEKAANHVRRNLVNDRQRVQDLLELDKALILTPDEPAPPMQAGEIERAWADLEQRFRKLSPPPENAKHHRGHWQSHALWLAACLLIGAWGFWQTPAPPRMLVADQTVILDLDVEVTRATPFQIAGNKSTSLNVLIPNRFRHFPYYRIEFVSAEEVLLSQRSTGPKANLPLFLQPNFFPKRGGYTLRIYGESDGRLTLLENFSLEVAF